MEDVPTTAVVWLRRHAENDEYELFHVKNLPRSCDLPHTRRCLPEKTKGAGVCRRPFYPPDVGQLARTYTQPASCARTQPNTPDGCRVTPGSIAATARERASSTEILAFFANPMEKNCIATLHPRTMPPLLMKFGSANASNCASISLRVEESSAGFLSVDCCVIGCVTLSSAPMAYLSQKSCWNARTSAACRSTRTVAVSVGFTPSSAWYWGSHIPARHTP